MPTEPLSDGEFLSFNRAEIKVVLRSGATKLFRGVTEVSYSSKLEPGAARGTHPQKLGRTLGDAEHEASMTLHKHVWLELLDFLTSEGDGYGEVPFSVDCHYAAPRLPLMTDRIVDARIKSVEDSHSRSSNDPLTVKLDLDVMNVLVAGKSIHSNPL